ncbi:hypothetical protein BDR07DRAFT_343827 [Suillus spraguei]|nr:hypothetical protein BDR07DRAFT_343827 [Suillus spraguei]
MRSSYLLISHYFCPDLRVYPLVSPSLTSCTHVLWIFKLPWSPNSYHAFDIPVTLRGRACTCSLSTVQLMCHHPYINLQFGYLDSSSAEFKQILLIKHDIISVTVLQYDVVYWYIIWFLLDSAVGGKYALCTWSKAPTRLAIRET